MRGAIEGLDGLLGLLVVGHFDETEAARAVGLAIDNHLGLDDGAELAEQFDQIIAGDAPGQVADVDILRHEKSSLSVPKPALITRDSVIDSESELHIPREEGMLAG